MRIKEIIDQSRRDFHAIYECEHCGATKKGRGYDDANYYQNVIPTMPCPECGKTAGDNYRPLQTKYKEGEQV